MTFAHIHNHTEWSPMDGLTTAREAAGRAAEDGCPALAQTDHGGCFGHPEHQAACDAAGVKPIFGTEAYFQPDRLIRPAPGDAEAQAALRNGDHLIVLAQGQQGLHDLWAASTESYVSGHYGRPRMDYELMRKYGADWTVTSSCLGGVISQDLLNGRYNQAFDRMESFREIFRGRFYLEIQANELPEQRRLNVMLAEISETMGVPLVAACDAHYPSEAHTALHKLWMQCRTGKGKDDYWHFSPMLTEARMREMLGYLPRAQVDAAMAATLEIADRCTARIDGRAEPPVFSKSGDPADDARRLMEMCRANWRKVPGGRVYEDRLEREFGVVSRKGLAGCYLIVEEIVSWVLQQGALVGPGRGSAAGSLMSYLLGITSIDPIPAGLLFERFLTEGRRDLPDFDLDFPSSWRTAIQQHVIDTYGEDHVVRVGTAMRYKAKGILNKLFSVLSDRLPQESEADARQIAGIIDDAESHTAGLGLPWSDILDEREIQAFVEKYPTVFDVAAELYGRLYSYGKHPAGLIISPQIPLAGSMPMRTAEGAQGLISQWDYRIAEQLGLLKLDLLTIRTLDTMQEAVSLVRARTGVTLDPRNWVIELEDPQVWDHIGTGQTLGMFQIETSLSRPYAQRHKPRRIEQLADLTTYIRPGPRNSGAAESYLRRLEGREPVDDLHPLLADHLRRSQGVMLYQEDILMAVRTLGGYDDLEADGVRKILGKKLTEKIDAAGEEFTRRGAERGHDPEQLATLWASIAEFGKYAFNRAHGYSYATLSYWTAWMMVHYPVEMITAILTTLDKMDRMAVFATEARRIGITILPPDVRFCGAGFTVEGLSIRYGLSSIPGVGPVAINQITRSQPYYSLEDFRQRSGVNIGVLYDLARAGALDGLVPSRRGLVRSLEAERAGDDVRCVHKDPEASGPNGLPCTYDWSNEPQPLPRIGKKGKPLKNDPKPPPKVCKINCRRYTPPDSLDYSGLAEYAPGELFRQENETYGTWMSEAPFEGLGTLRTQARQIALALPGAPEGTYPLAAVYGGSHRARTRAGNAMWWVSLVTEVSILDLACFSPRRDDEPDLPAVLRTIRPGTLVSAEVVKRSYEAAGKGRRTGWRLENIFPVGA
jgi:DNA polymerase-3 subunit alpha